MRPGRKVLWERKPEGYPRYRILSLPFPAELTSRMMLPEALELIAYAQRFAENEARHPVSLTLAATVQHGNPIAYSYTLHFEVIPA